MKILFSANQRNIEYKQKWVYLILAAGLIPIRKGILTIKDGFSKVATFLNIKHIVEV